MKKTVTNLSITEKISQKGSNLAGSAPFDTNSTDTQRVFNSSNASNLRTEQHIRVPIKSLSAQIVEQSRQLCIALTVIARHPKLIEEFKERVRSETNGLAEEEDQAVLVPSV